MSDMRSHVVVAGLLCAIVWTAAGRLSAQRETPQEVRPPFAPLRGGPVLSGENIGVRLTGAADPRTGVVGGTLVVRVNGQWLDVALHSPAAVVPAGR